MWLWSWEGRTVLRPRGNVVLILPEGLREEVRKPFGKLIASKAELYKALKTAARPLVSVGDQCTHDLIQMGLIPDMIVVDFKIRREEIGGEMKKVIAPYAKSAFVVLSAPGRISDQLSEAVGIVLSEGRGAIFVAGEDDLSALLIMARAAAGTLVYGQPDEGAVVVPLGGDEVRKKAGGFLERMEKI